MFASTTHLLTRQQNTALRLESRTPRKFARHTDALTLDANIPHAPLHPFATCLLDPRTYSFSVLRTCVNQHSSQPPIVNPHNTRTPPKRQTNEHTLSAMPKASLSVGKSSARHLSSDSASMAADGASAFAPAAAAAAAATVLPSSIGLLALAVN